MISFSFSRRSRYFATNLTDFRYFTIELVFAISCCLRLSLSAFAPRKSECVEQGSSFFVRFRIGHKSNVHSKARIRRVILHFRKNELFFEAQGVIASAIESFLG